MEARYVLSGDIAGVFGSAVSLVADLNRTPIAAEIDASVRFKDAEYFSLETVNSLELWKTDGTTEETELLHVLSSDCLPQGSEPGTSPRCSLHGFHQVSDQLYFAVAGHDDGATLTLWKSDGTPTGTQPIGIIGDGWDPFAGSISADFRTLDDRRVLIQVNSSSTGDSRDRLWLTDGEHLRVADTIFDGIWTSGIGTLAQAEHGWVFDGTRNESEYGIWRVDIEGDAPNVSLVMPFEGNFFGIKGPEELTEFNGSVFFSASTDGNGFELWKTDGTANGTVLVKDINTTNDPPIRCVSGRCFHSNTAKGSLPQHLTVLNGVLYFTAYSPEHGRALWKSDGTEAGTTQVRSFEVDGSHATTEILGVHAQRLILRVDGENWVSDGTAEGTIREQVSLERPSASVRVQNGQIVFTGDDAVTPIFDLTGSLGSHPFQLESDGRRLYFMIQTADKSADEIWTTDGSEAGTVRAADVDPGFELVELVDWNATLYVLTSTNGTYRFAVNTLVGAETEQTLQPISPRQFEAYPGSVAYARDQGTMFIHFSNSSGRRVLRIEANTHEIQLHRAVSPAPTQSPIEIFGDDAYFIEQDRLWRINDVETIVVGPTNVVSMASAGDKLYVLRTPPRNPPNQIALSADTNQDGFVDSDDFRILQRYYGEETKRGAGRADFDGDGHVQFDDFLKLAAEYNHATFSYELWSLTSPDASPEYVRDIVPKASAPRYHKPTMSSVIDQIVIATPDGTLWNEHGPITSPRPAGSISTFTQVEDKLHFVLSKDHAHELWVTDGTESGTNLLATSTALVSHLFAMEDRLFFSFDDGIHGRELWVSDGTPDNTELAADVRPGPGGSDPDELTSHAGDLYFAAQNAEGRELWKLDFDQPVAAN